MEFTGERVIPGQVNADLWAEHVSRYRFAANVAEHLGYEPAVLDIGCGAGYGTHALAQHATSATGVDLAPDAIDYARAHYGNSHVEFLAASATKLPFADASYDLIVAFEVIEHLADWKAMLAETRRVLRPAGVFLVSTPNTTYYAETRSRQGPNPYHVHEFTFDEFSAALAAFFPACAVLMQNHVDAFAFYDPQATLPVDGFLEVTSADPANAHFFLGVCSSRPLPPLRSFLFIPHATNLLREREHHIELVEEQLVVARAERDEMIRVHEKQAGELQNQAAWARQLDQDLKTKEAALKTVVDLLTTAEASVVERTQWAQKTDAEVVALEDKLLEVRHSRWLRLGQQLGFGPKIEVTKTRRSKTDHNV